MEPAGASALVTGASGGLGRAISKGLAAAGADLVLSGRDEHRLGPIAAETGAGTIIADLGGDLAELVAAAADVEVLVLNAAVDGGARIEDDTLDHADEVVRVNLTSAIALSTAFAQGRIRAGSPGHLVLIGSVAGLAASPLHRLYNASKFGLRGFGLALRQDLAPRGVGVTVVTPAYIRDAGMFADSGISLPWFVRTKSPQDVADAVLRAIRTNPAEIFVAAPELRLAAVVATVAPGLAAWAHGHLGMDEEVGRARRSAPDHEQVGQR